MLLKQDANLQSLCFLSGCEFTSILLIHKLVFANVQKSLVLFTRTSEHNSAIHCARIARNCDLCAAFVHSFGTRGEVLRRKTPFLLNISLQLFLRQAQGKLLKQQT